MTTTRRRRTTRWSAVLFGVSSLVLAHASPAAAATGGGTTEDGTYSITGTGISGFPPCAEITAFDYVGHDTSGTYSAGTSSYTGPVTLTLEATETFYESPAGTHGQDDTCNLSTAGDPVDVNAGSRGFIGQGGSGGGVDCDYTGTYSRLNTNPSDPYNPDTEIQETTAELTGNCDVKDMTTGIVVSNSATDELREGLLGECTGAPPTGGPPSSCESTDDYTATNA